MASASTSPFRPRFEVENVLLVPSPRKVFGRTKVGSTVQPTAGNALTTKGPRSTSRQQVPERPTFQMPAPPSRLRGPVGQRDRLRIEAARSLSQDLETVPPKGVDVFGRLADQNDGEWLEGRRHGPELQALSSDEVMRLG